MSSKKHPLVVGIDLGTSNSALAFGTSDSDEIRSLAIEQIAGPGSWQPASTLPSCLYIPHTSELADCELLTPWGEEVDPKEPVVGGWARSRGEETEGRLVSSAKSWLCQRFVDRRSAILPWQSDISSKYSPVDASARYLAHLRKCFEHEQCTDKDASFDLDDAEVVVTVPASFDEVARRLTVEAAETAGFKQVTLLEEPQAAFYSWIDHHKKDWRKSIEAGDVVLVCDVGGGTTDFSLIAVGDEGGQLQLDRLSVGDHLLLGGDNMDLALAHAVASDFSEQGIELDQWQFQQVTMVVRQAKEALLADTSLEEVPISLAGKGSSLLASTLSTKITRAQVDRWIVEGFFPLLTNDQVADELVTSNSGLLDFGLSYETNPAVTWHLAQFLKRAKRLTDHDSELAKVAQRGLQSDLDMVVPTTILFNGGVFKAPALRQRICQVLDGWQAQGQKVKELSAVDLDLAVARGAAGYAYTKATGEGVRIAAGTSRSYYVGVEQSRPAVPGRRPPMQGVCLVPQGTEEGSALSFEQRSFGLITGRPVSFRFFSSADRIQDQVGSVVSEPAKNLDETNCLDLTLPGEPGAMVPVNLAADYSETGTLHLFLQHTQDRDQRWELEFNLRASEQGTAYDAG